MIRQAENYNNTIFEIKYSKDIIKRFIFILYSTKQIIAVGQSQKFRPSKVNELANE